MNGFFLILKCFLIITENRSLFRISRRKPKVKAIGIEYINLSMDGYFPAMANESMASGV